ncbi:unnamed protein product, partial [marine sediment metagenome]
MWRVTPLGSPETEAPDGNDTYEFSEPPTPGVSNITTVVINEVLA